MDGTAADTDFRSLTSRQSLREIEEALRNVRQSIALSELDAVPRLVASPPFPYPRALTRRGILEGKVVFQLQISMEGEPRVLKILSADHPLLSEAALRWLENCRFTEPRYRGKATDARGQWTVTFASERP
jgi:outer membrane biosynthesis protein TonB